MVPFPPRPASRRIISRPERLRLHAAWWHWCGSPGGSPALCGPWFTSDGWVDGVVATAITGVTATITGDMTCYGWYVVWPAMKMFEIWKKNHGLLVPWISYVIWCNPGDDIARVIISTSNNWGLGWGFHRPWLSYEFQSFVRIGWDVQSGAPHLVNQRTSPERKMMEDDCFGRYS